MGWVLTVLIIDKAPHDLTRASIFAVLLDTTPDIEARQVQIWRRLGGEERLRLGFELSLFAQKLATAGARQAHSQSPSQASVSPDPVSDRATSIVPIKTLQQITQTLTKLGICYMLTGCCASNYHGAPRSTVDIDFLIVANAREIEGLLKLLPINDYRFDLATAIEAAQGQSAFHIIHNASGWKIELLFFGSTTFDEQRLQHRQQIMVEEASLFIESPESLVVSQLQWTKSGHSSRQIEDAAGILKLHGTSLDFDYIENWVNRLGLSSQWAAARKLAVLP